MGGYLLFLLLSILEGSLFTWLLLNYAGEYGTGSNGGFFFALLASGLRYGTICLFFPLIVFTLSAP